MIEVKNLQKTFKGSPIKALDNINFKVEAGDFFCVIGADAAGKTTLLRILASVLGFDAGEIEILGRKSLQKATLKYAANAMIHSPRSDSNLINYIPKPTENTDFNKNQKSIADEAIHSPRSNSEQTQIRRKSNLIAYMPQKFGLYEDLSVLENLDLYADLRGVLGAEKKLRIEQLLQATNLKDFTARFAGKLSGGMKQKLSLACTLIARPKILLLDEVSVGVDPISRQDLVSIVKNLSSDFGAAVVWSTTYLDEAKHANKVLLLNEGKQVFFGAPQDFIAQTLGRTFLLEAKDSGSNRRDNLNDVLQSEQTIDAVLQGNKIRILSKNNQPKGFDKNYKIISTPASIEDSFLENLNLKLPANSALAARYNKKILQEKIVIEAKNLTKKFGDFVATNNVNFQIKSGKIFGLLGPNGAGKSTTFKMLCGLLKPSFGTAKVSGISLLDSANEARQKIGYMAQKFSLYGELSVAQNLKFFSGIYGLSNADSKISTQEVVESLDLKNFVKTNANQLPLGIKQRLALGCALLHKPEVLFLDEPTSGVDPATRREFWFHINALAQKGVTIMATTHFMDEAEYCDNVAIIYKGLKIAEDDPQALKERLRGEKFADPTFQDVFFEAIKNHDLSEVLKK